jgi:hypothetical protein
VTHEFLYKPECPVALIGRDLLSKVWAQVTFQEDGQAVLSFGSETPRVLALVTPWEEECRLHSVETALKGPEIPFKVPGVWAEDSPLGLAVNIPPVVIEIKAGVTPIRVRQYPIPMRAQEGISHHLQRLLNYGILRPCQCAWNTPLLPVQKPGTNDYRPVQDLWAVNQAAVTLHLMVPNPYTLLALILAEATCFSCLDLKDAFFCVHLAPVSQPILLSNGRTPSQGDNNS